jgi:hypothetical protein
VLADGTNTAVTGSGSTANPYRVNAVVTCDQVRPCISAAPGLTYNSTTGVMGPQISPDAGNNIVVHPNGLFVPTGSATVSVGCGILGNGSAGSPVRVNSQTWPYPCLVTTGSVVSCDPATGLLWGAPPYKNMFYGQSFNLSPAPTAVPAADTTIQTVNVTVTNTDTCRTARLIVARMVDVDFTLPVGATATTMINGDHMEYRQNTGTATQTTVHNQEVKIGDGGTLPPGGSTVFAFQVGLSRGRGGAQFTRIQADVQVWTFSTE